ncbi:MAG TPA: OmpH family outer membrane protein [Tenuifilaceae bacterium]|nr:OmpH family outer membrane protein [Tenuifilaceae bacterium]HPE17883.1 OmpH family outer membrane protein [Tenuifilaceae bacterium]HPJ45359.1 OmpH family outer membrane protein [Tenuifilaceae bacterium]HPQ33600.1 OmpH family outer membrane protein [Tenuifilaceae bacterium]HRX67386.1 OmpH family outer membrane protein [Tenuifilaceae bacterium]
MKRTLFISIAVATMLFSSNTMAQNLKFGHINGQELITLMPERDSAEVKLKAYGADLTEQIEQLYVEYNNKAQNYQQRRNTLTDAIREQREKELSDLEQRIREFEATAQQDYQRMQGEMMQPIMEKADAAIKKVAKENGFLYIFDISAGGVVYFSDSSVDILPLVKKELGITQ